MEQERERAETKSSGLGELQVPRDQNGVDVLELDDAAVIDEENMVFESRYLPRQKNVDTSDFMPAWLENGVRKNDLGGTEVLDFDGRCCDLHNLGNVEWAGWVVADGNELVFREELAACLVETFGGGIGLGPVGFIWQNICCNLLILSVMELYLLYTM